MGGFRQMLIIAYILGGWVSRNSYVRISYVKRTRHMQNFPPIYQTCLKKWADCWSLLFYLHFQFQYCIKISMKRTYQNFWWGSVWRKSYVIFGVGKAYAYILLNNGWVGLKNKKSAYEICEQSLIPNPVHFKKWF